MLRVVNLHKSGRLIRRFKYASIIAVFLKKDTFILQILKVSGARMTTVSMDLVKQLRDKTQISLMDCKKALIDSEGDFEKALEFLRKKGAAVAAKRADNVTNHGRVESFVAVDGKVGALIETACETDFSANTESMRDFALHVAEHLAHKDAKDVEELMTQPHAKHAPLTIKGMLDELTAKICENIKINRFDRFVVAGHGLVNVYIHPGSTVGVMVELETDKDAAPQAQELKSLARDICMQIAVTNPVCVAPENLDPALVAKEREIATEQLKESGKPAQVIEKIVDGKLGKFYQDACLLNQPFIKDEKQTVAQIIQAAAKNLSLTIKVKRFKRFSIGR